MVPLELFEQQFTTMLTMINDKQISELINMIDSFTDYIDKKISEGCMNDENHQYFGITSSYIRYATHMFLLAIYKKRPLEQYEEEALVELENMMFENMSKQSVAKYVEANGRRKEYYDNIKCEPEFETNKPRGSVEMRIVKPVGDA